MLKLWSVFIAFSFSFPAFAQHAEYIDFSGNASEEAVSGDISDVLKNDFSVLGLPPVESEGTLPDVPDYSIPSTSSISVPLWMQTGVLPPALMDYVTDKSRPFQDFSSFALPDAVANCAQSLLPRPDLSRAAQRRRTNLFPLAARIACEEGVSPILFDALIVQESRYNITALSPVGASGLTQLMPGTARQLGVTNRWDVHQNLRGGARYLRQQLDRFGRVDLALAAYNSGPGRVAKLGRIPRITETQNYVRSIERVLWSASEDGLPNIFASEVLSQDQPLVDKLRFAQLISF